MSAYLNKTLQSGRTAGAVLPEDVVVAATAIPFEKLTGNADAVMVPTLVPAIGTIMYGVVVPNVTELAADTLKN